MNTAAGNGPERTLALRGRDHGIQPPPRPRPAGEEFTAFVVLGGLVRRGIFLALGRWYPGSGAEQVDWRLTRSPEVEAELEIDDVDQMIEAQNRRRRATGRAEVTEADIRAQVAADQAWREELRRRAAQDRPPDPED